MQQKLKNKWKKTLNKYWKWIAVTMFMVIAVIIPNAILASMFEVMAAVGYIDLMLGLEILPTRRKKVFKKLKDTAQAIRQIEKEIVANDN